MCDNTLDDAGLEPLGTLGGEWAAARLDQWASQDVLICPHASPARELGSEDHGLVVVHDNAVLAMPVHRS